MEGAGLNLPSDSSSFTSFCIFHKPTIPIQSQSPEPISATAAAPDLLRGLNTSASSLSTETCPFPTTSNKFAALSTEQPSVPLPESAATTSKSEPSNV
ncbi:hypothetical protein TNCV_2092811 [Trichonephila clavipes]|nr:hypothetical protein TNCV_2092811 [Trichonephila clavipes]